MCTVQVEVQLALKNNLGLGSVVSLDVTSTDEPVADTFVGSGEEVVDNEIYVDEDTSTTTTIPTPVMQSTTGATSGTTPMDFIQMMPHCGGRRAGKRVQYRVRYANTHSHLSGCI
jgi:hypothetical protein